MHDGPNVSSRIRPGVGGGASEMVRGDQFLGGTKFFVTGLMGEQGAESTMPSSTYLFWSGTRNQLDKFKSIMQEHWLCSTKYVRHCSTLLRKLHMNLR